MILSKRSSLGSRKVSPPQPICMTDEQKGSYLASLRSSRPSRPAGSRPAPFKTSVLPLQSQYVSSLPENSQIKNEGIGQERRHSVQEPHLSTNQSSTVEPHLIVSNASVKGRPLAKGPSEATPPRNSQKPIPSTGRSRVQRQSTDLSYVESTSTLLEKEEAHTLREALKIIDNDDQEARIFEAAQMEAADLVWKHRNPHAAEAEKVAPYANPDQQIKKSYGSELIVKPNLPVETHSSITNNQSRSASDSSTTSQQSNKEDGKIRRRSQRLSEALQQLQRASDERSAKIISAVTTDRRRSSGQRQVSGGSTRTLSRIADVQIYEEPSIDKQREASNNVISHSLPLRNRERNSLPFGSRPLPEKSFTTPVGLRKGINIVDIYKNVPTQSRNAAYTSNFATSTPVEVIEEVETPKSKSSLEIRSDDIRAATSMKRKDRSPNLPTPTAVSDVLGRPIVSFDRGWRARESPKSDYDSTRPKIQINSPGESSKSSPRPAPRVIPDLPSVVVSAPIIPTINFPDEDEIATAADIPIINVEVEKSALPPKKSNSFPQIQVETPTKSSTRPLPRPLPKVEVNSAPAVPTASNPTPPATRTSRLPWLNGPSRITAPAATCASCSLPISGRIVTASGSSSNSPKIRFHPECFRCAHCSTALECVSFYPEPESSRVSRLESSGIDSTSPGFETLDPRFYCHLDFHEFFSPRCRSCKTPIEGEVIIAAGGEWHVGHFFCAECGDPFDQNKPFVEKEGHAYCVSCHTRRTSARCRECKNLITDEMTVEALGGKWHDHCFVCYECGNGFEEHGGRFFVRDISVEPTEKEKRRGIMRKTEEKAVCVGCEERRLKS